MRHPGVLVYCIVLLLLAACSSSAPVGSIRPTPTVMLPTATSTTITPVPTPTIVPRHHMDVTYHNGPVQLAPSSYLIFWGLGWLHDPELQTTKRTLESYFQNVGGSSYERTLTQYYMTRPDGSRAFISPVARFSEKQVWVDPLNPQNDDRQHCSKPAISDEAIQQEIAHALAVTHWARDDQNVTYFVYTPPSFIVYEPTWGCSGQNWGADHEWASGRPAMPVSYAAMPYPDSTPCGFVTDDNTPFSSDTACNAALLVVSSGHEQFEAITDPTPGRADDTTYKHEGWFYVDPHNGASEIGDLCGGHKHLIPLHNASFVLQPMWSNRAGGCVYQP